MFEMTRKVGVVIWLSMAVASAASHASPVSDGQPVPSLRSLDLAVAVPESAVDLGGPAWSATVLTRPVLEFIPGLPSDVAASVQWVNGCDLPSLLELLGEGRGIRGRVEPLFEASNLEAPMARVILTQVSTQVSVERWGQEPQEPTVLGRR